MSAQFLEFPAESLDNDYWVPNPGPQEAFVESDVPDVCYGGARGGAKTAGIMLAWKRHYDLYGKNVRGIITRKTFDELTEVIATGKKLLEQQWGWRYTASGENAHCFTSPDGAQLFCRYLRTLDDAKGHDGKQFSFIGNDEIGGYADPEPLDYLLGTLRSPYGIPCVRRSSCMPGGPGHVWVRDRYRPDTVPAGEVGEIFLRHPFPNDKDEKRRSMTIETLFISALLEDNPHINPDQYELMLAAQGNAALFDAWRHGKWDVIAGAFFKNWDPSTMTLDPGAVKIEPWDTRWISMDWGYRDDCVIHWHAQNTAREIVTYRELKVNETIPTKVADRIVTLTGDEKLSNFFLGPDAWAQRDSPRTIAGEIDKIMVVSGLPRPSRADTDRAGGWMLMGQLLETGMWKISRACPELVKAMPLLQVHPKDSSDIDEAKFDHAPDSARYGLKTFVRDAKVPYEVRVQRYVTEKMGKPLVSPAAPVAPEAFDWQADMEAHGELRIGNGGRILNRPADHPLQPRVEVGTDYNRIARLTAKAEAVNHKRYRPRPKPRWR